MARRKAMSGSGKKALNPGAVASRKTVASRVEPLAPEAVPAPIPTPPARLRARPVAAPGPAASGARAASLARRKALSSHGKIAVKSKDRVRDTGMRRNVDSTASAGMATKVNDKACSCGCKDRREAETPKTVRAPSQPNGRSKMRAPRRPEVSINPGRAASLARRRAQSSRGKAGMAASGISAAQAARATNPELAGRELARALRDQRSKRGGAGQKKSAPCGRRRSKPNADNGLTPGAAQDQPWKVGAGETSYGQTVTGTQVGRSKSVTGDEPSTCRTVTGTEYMGADIFREFCQAEPAKAVVRVGTSSTSRGNAVTGNEVGRSIKVTGDEPGTCKRVTGTEYVGAEQTEAYCGSSPEPGPSKIAGSETRKGQTVTGYLVGRSKHVTGNETGADRQLTGTQYTQLAEAGVPPKVGTSATLRGGFVTGTLVGRRQQMTGDESGSCRAITGDEYIGQEQYNEFCQTTPAPNDPKVGVSKTLSGETVTGTMTGRSNRVTGDEPGTCKAITGTPYAGVEQYSDYCKPRQTEMAAARMQLSKRGAGAPMTGIQPSVGGKMTGDEKGACETVSGTPYVGADQQAEACPALPAEPGSPDFPQPLTTVPWGAFSVVPPSHATAATQHPTGVTGTGYEQGQITGPFGMATGKVTGTEEARFGHVDNPYSVPEEQPKTDSRIKTRITGEGIDVGSKITGDDWERGDQVTGTEGASAKRRNPTRRGGPMSAMAPLRVGSRKEDLPEPISKVTGGSGSTERGALVTYSGGARG